MTFHPPSHSSFIEGSHLFDMIRSFFQQRPMALFVGVAFVATSLGCESGDPVEQAKTYLDQGRARAAIELLAPVVQEQRDNFDAQFYYGVALTTAGEGGLAEWSLRRAMNDPSRRREAGLMIVQNALQGSNPDEAVKILSQMLEDDADNVDLLLARANAYAKTRIHVDEVLADVDRVREIDPENPEADRAEILGYLLAAMTDEAAEALDALGKRLAEEAESESIDSWYCTTMALFAKESLEMELARERFDACVDKHPADVSVIVAATDFFRAEKQIDRAIEVLERAMALNEGRDELGLGPRLAEIFFGLGRFEEAEALLIEATQTENLRTSLAYKFQLSEFYEAQGRLDEALEQYEEALAIMMDLRSPTATVEFRMADLAIRVGDLDRALEIAMWLEHPPLRFMIEARVAQEREDHAQAISLYEEAARLWPDNEYARYHAARSAEQIGDFDAAIELYRHATRISVETTNAMSRIAVLLYASGDAVEAYNLLNLQEKRAPLDETGELLRVELMVLLGQMTRVPKYLADLPPQDSVGVAPRLARVFRALRRRGQSEQAIEFASSGNPGVFATGGGAEALEELTQAAGDRSEALVRVTAMLDTATGLRPDSAGLKAVRGLLAERLGEDPEVVAAAYRAALELDPNEPIALLGHARSLVDEDAEASLALGKHALEAESVDTQRVRELALQLQSAGAETQALELFRLILRHTPYDGIAARALATAALASGDHSDRTLDFARRAARFAASEQSVTLLRDTYVARGEQAEADVLTKRLDEHKQRAEKEAATPSTKSDAG
jgi:tetratricopeptide (TPR) repeat protein